MRFHPILLILLTLVLVTLAMVRLFQKEVVHHLFGFMTQPQLENALQQAGEDLRTLAKTNPTQAEAYKARFEEVQALRNNLQVLRMTREQMTTRFEILLTGLFGLAGLLALTYHLLSHRFAQRRLERLREPLRALALGQEGVIIPHVRGGLMGDMARMIEDTSQVISQQRTKLGYLDCLQDWQEVTRHQVHEIRKPLTAAQLELERLSQLQRRNAEAKAIQDCQESIAEELRRLNAYLQEIASFGKIGKPQLETLDLKGFLDQFCQKFATAWPNLDLVRANDRGKATSLADPYLTRQVLMNLCTNSSQALPPGVQGKMQLWLETTPHSIQLVTQDDGPGIDPRLQHRLFQPYATLRREQGGTGLGLAISRKIMLEQQGDLVWDASQADGACFRLSLPKINPDAVEDI